MRDVVFRGELLSNGQWYHGVPIEHHGGDYWLLCGANKLAVKPNTIGQYTGINDIYGKMIYEHDIIKVTDCYNNETIYAVDYKPGGFCANQKGVNFSTNLGDLYNGEYDIEVIGDIFNNSDLLK